MLSYKSQLIKTSVTAIHISDDFLLVGIGSTLHIYHKNTTLLVHQLVVPNTRGENIYGIVHYHRNRVLVYGGQFITVFEVNDNFTCFHKLAENTLLDWILHAKIIENNKFIVAISLQNKLYIWNSELKLSEVVESEEKCILYSAHICYDQFNDLTILSGTVFSEILIWKLFKRNDNDIPVILKRLQKHNGVIFSLDYNEHAGFICSSSDDRTAVLWKVDKKNLSLELEQETINITPQCQVSGHSARIFRCRVLKNCFLTAGEDSVLNIWSLDGRLVRKVETHQGSPIWSLDCNEDENFIVTGGGDDGLSTFPIHFDGVEEKLILPNRETPKVVCILRSLNLAVFTESGLLYIHLKTDRTWTLVGDHEELKNYIVMEVSACRNLVALAGFYGNIHVYREQKNTLHHFSSWKINSQSRIASLHWLTCKSLLVCQDNGNMTVFYLKETAFLPISSFILPPSSERWTTTATVFDGNIVVGDRRGNIHLYKSGNRNPVQTLKKAHSHLGVTKLIGKKNYIISLGRNAIMKHFSVGDNVLKVISSNKLPFSWLLNIFGNTLIAFSSNNFIIFDCDSKRVLFEAPCGGGHRSWDFHKHANTSTFVYVKDKIIRRIQLNMTRSMPHNLIEGYHSKEINGIQILKGLSEYILISGGEDTTLRISTIQFNGDHFKTRVTLKSHLSSIRSLTVHKLNEVMEKGRETFLVFSAGGRAQILCWKLECFFDENVLQNLICSEQHSYYKKIDNMESEMRIMDLCVAEIKNKIALFSACSDGNIQIFHVEHNNDNFHLKFHKNIFYRLKCILKVCHISLFRYNILVSVATDGKLVFWDVADVFEDNEIRPFDSLPAHQSGINTLTVRELGNNYYIFLTGGDDNSIVLNYVNFYSEQSNLELKKIDTFVDVGSHWAQITASFINDFFFMTASLDQRLVVFKWRIENKKIVCERISKYNTSITDLKGLVCSQHSDYFDIILYGNGIEFVKVVEE